MCCELAKCQAPLNDDGVEQKNADLPEVTFFKVKGVFLMYIPELLTHATLLGQCALSTLFVAPLCAACTLVVNSMVDSASFNCLYSLVCLIY